MILVATILVLYRFCWLFPKSDSFLLALFHLHLFIFLFFLKRDPIIEKDFILPTESLLDHPYAWERSCGLHEQLSINNQACACKKIKQQFSQQLIRAGISMFRVFQVSKKPRLYQKIQKILYTYIILFSSSQFLDLPMHYRLLHMTALDRHQVLAKSIFFQKNVAFVELLEQYLQIPLITVKH